MKALSRVKLWQLKVSHKKNGANRELLPQLACFLLYENLDCPRHHRVQVIAI